MKKNFFRQYFLIFCLLFSLFYFHSMTANGSTIEIKGNIGGEVLKEKDTEETKPNPIYPSEELASPYEDEIVLRRFPNTGEHSTYFHFIGLGCFLLLILLTIRKIKSEHNEQNIE